MRFEKQGCSVVEKEGCHYPKLKCVVRRVSGEEREEEEKVGAVELSKGV